MRRFAAVYRLGSSGDRGGGGAEAARALSAWTVLAIRRAWAAGVSPGGGTGVAGTGDVGLGVGTGLGEGSSTATGVAAEPAPELPLSAGGGLEPVGFGVGVAGALGPGAGWVPRGVVGADIVGAASGVPPPVAGVCRVGVLNTTIGAMPERVAAASS
jgi:hypothetical protein